MKEGLNIALLFSNLKAFNSETNRLIEDQWVFKSLGINQSLAKKAREFFFERIKSIEFLDQNQQVQKYYFPVPAIQKFHSKLSQSVFEEHVDRRNSHSKLSAMLAHVPFCNYEMHHLRKLHCKGLKIGISSLYKLRHLNFVLAMVANLFLVVFKNLFSERVSNSSFDGLKNANGEDAVLFIIGVLILLGNVFAFVLYAILEFPLTMNKIVREEQERQRIQREEKSKVNPQIFGR